VSFDKLRTNGFFPFMVSHFGKLRTGLSNHQALEHPDFGIASSEPGIEAKEGPSVLQYTINIS
jgi:hypothetical protein